MHLDALVDGYDVAIHPQVHDRGSHGVLTVWLVSGGLVVTKNTCSAIHPTYDAFCEDILHRKWTMHLIVHASAGGILTDDDSE